MARTLELLLEMKGKLEKSYPEAVRKAAAEAGELKEKLSSLNEVKIKSDKYKDLAKAAQDLGPQFYKAKLQAALLEGEIKKSQMTAAQYKVKLDEARKAMAGMSRSTNPEAYKTARANIEQLANAYKAANAATKNLKKNFNDMAGDVRAAGMAYYGNQEKLRQLTNELQKAEFDTKHFASSQIILQQEINRTSRAYAQAEKAKQQYDMQQASRAKVQKNLEDKQQNLYNAYGNFENAKSMAGTIMSPFMGAVKTAADFEQVMAKVKAITGSNTQEMSKLEAQAKALGSSTQFSMTQAGEAMTYLGMAGWKTEQILGGMPGLLNLAAAAGADLAQTADIVSDGMTALGMTAGQKIPNAFGQMVDSTTHFADVMAAASSNANTNVQMMGETFKYAASTAGALGYSIDDLGLATGLMANAGIKGSNAGTALRSIFTRMSTETDSAAQAMNMLGISMTEVGADGQQKMKSFTKVIQEMRGAFKNIDASKLTDMVETMSGSKMKNKDAMVDMLNRIKENGGVLSEIDKVKFSNMLAGQEAMAGLLSLVMGSDEDFNKLFNSIQKCDGKSAEMAKTMTNTYAGAVTAYESALEGLKQNVGSTFLPVLTQAAKYAGAFASDLIKWTSEHKTLVQWVGILAGALAGMAVLVTGVALAFAGWQFITAQLMVMKGAIMGMRAAQLLWASATGVVTAAQWLLNAALTANPIGLVIMGIAALIAIGYLLISNWEAVKAWFVLLWNDPKAAIDQFVGFLREKIGGAVDWVIERWNTLKSALAHPLDAAVNFVTTGSVVGGEVTAKTAQDYSLADSQMSGADAMRGLREAGTNPQVVADAQQIASAAGDASTNAQNYAANMQQAGSYAQQAAEHTQHIQQSLLNMPTDAKNGFTDLMGASGNAVQTVQSNLGQIPQIASNSFGQVPNSAQTAFAQLPPIAQTNTDGMVAEFNKLAEKSQPGGDAFIQAANTWGEGAYNSVADWSVRMAETVTEKLMTAWNQISEQFSAGLNVNVTTTSVASVAHNAKGGIYPKGAFLTTFAEEGPEAAIPLDGSSRAVSLWQKAGEMLGVLPQGQPSGIGMVGNIPSSIEAVMPKIGLPKLEMPGNIPSVIEAIMPKTQSPVIELANALPADMGTVAEIAAPPTETEMAAAPVAMEPVRSIGTNTIEINMPAITINGNADAGTVNQLEGLMEQMKADLMREVRKQFPGMVASNDHRERRLSYAT